MKVAFSDLPGLSGATLGPTPYRRVSQDDIDRFAEVTGDRQWIHVDVDRAGSGPFGSTIAHGFLTLSLLGTLWPQLLHITGASAQINYGLDRLRFTGVVRSGSRVRLRATVGRVEPIAAGHRLHAHQTIEIEGEERPALVADSLYDIHGPENA